MPKAKETPILNRIAELNDGRSAITGEHSGKGYLGSLRSEAPIISRGKPWEGMQRLPEKDTEHTYAFKTRAGYRSFFKTDVDKNLF